MTTGLGVFVSGHEMLFVNETLFVNNAFREVATYSWSFGIGWVAAGAHLISAVVFGAGVKFIWDEVHK